MKKGRVFAKKGTSLALVLSLMVTLPQTFTMNGIVANAEETDQSGTEGSESASSYQAAVSNLLQIQIGDNTSTMQLYQNGVYETALELAAGEYSVSLLVNGGTVNLSDRVSLTEAQTVYFRVQDGTLIDSINQADSWHTAALTGSFDGVVFQDAEGTVKDIADWTPADANAELDYIGGGRYEETFYYSFDELAGDDETSSDTRDIKYKIAFDDGWDYSLGEGSSNGDISLTLPAGSSELTVYADTINGTVYDSIRSEGAAVTQNDGSSYVLAPFTGSVSLVGTARCAGDSNWNQTLEGYEFTQITDSLYLYQKDFAAGTYLYKTVFDHNKWYEKTDNKSFSLTEDAHVVFLYDASTESIYDSVNSESTIAQLLGMEAAPAESKVVTNANGTTNFVTVQDDAETVSLVYGTKSEVEADSTAVKKVELTKQTDGSFATGELFLGDEAVDLVYYYLVDGKKQLDGSAEAAVVAEVDYSVYTRDAFTGRCVNVPGTFPGNSWDAASNVMTYQGNGLYAYTFSAVPAANYQFKISMGSWDENYGVDGASDGANYSVTVAEKQDVTVYYNDFSHRAVTSIDYVFADITLAGTGIAEDTKLTDSGLTGIYSVTVALAAGEYGDLAISYAGEGYSINAFTLEEDKKVSFYFDPDSYVYYNDATNVELDTENIYYDTKDTAYKSVYGAVATGEDVTFTIHTGEDAASVNMIFKGTEKKNLTMEKVGEAQDGVQSWSVTTNFSTIGENTYYFVISNGSSVKIYADDDGYYGTGKVTDLTSITPYDLVVYQSGYETPDWMKNAVIYQIFPDRFYDGDTSNDLAQTTSRGATDYEYVTDWYAYPENPEQETLNPDTYPENAFSGDGNYSNEIYGGDIEGITDKIDYLKALGVSVIYINPVFSSISSHRYDTSDYNEIDPILGDLGDFEELVAAADDNDMHIVLDGVFNHVSDDSVYFDRYYKYLEAGTDTVGAYPFWAYVYDYENEHTDVTEAEAKEIAKTYFKKNYGITDFSYVDWFDFDGKDSVMLNSDGSEVKDTIGNRTDKGVYSYDCWWGYDSMPVIAATDGSEYQTEGWAEEIIGTNETSTTSDGSVAQYWLSEGSDGWRLDVANEVSDETWQHFRKSVKALSSDNVIIGEIWDDATEYLLGDMYDSVMNYVFRDAVLAFAKGGDVSASVKTLEKLRERYPKEAYYAMMNLVSSHDTTRVLSYLDGIEDDRKQTETENAFPTYETTSDLAKQRQYLVAFLQMTYPGAPTIYYGDEIGMVGADDPDDRRAFTWGEGNQELVTWYATLAQTRNTYSALRTGDITSFDAVGTDGKTLSSVMAFTRSDESNTMVVLANNAQTDAGIVVPVQEQGVTASKVTDLITGTEYEVADGKITVTVSALSGAILVDSAQVENITLDTDSLSQAYDSAYTVSDSARAVAVTGITFSQTKLSLEIGKTATLKAVLAPANATNTSLTWKSSNEKVATVVNGKLTAKTAGTTEITVKATTGSIASCVVTVKAKETVTTPAKVASTKVTLNKAALTLVKGKTQTLKATMAPKNTTDTLTWSVKNKKVATVDKNGKVTAVAAGSTTVTVKTTSGKTASCKVTVTVPSTKVTLSAKSIKLEKGKTKTLKATVTPKTSTDKVSFTSSNKKIATVSSSGKVKAVKVGSATITVKTSSGKTAKCKVSVTQKSTKVSLNKSKLTLKKGKTSVLKATLIPKSSTDTVTFSSSNKKVATVSKSGKVKAVKKGTATITVKTTSGKKATCKITVK